MSTSNILFPAVEALRQKIIASAETANPEQLAYLASAIEKIAGQTNLLDIANAAQEAIERVETEAASRVNAALAAITDAQTQAQSTVTQTAQNQVQFAQGQVNTAVQQAQTATTNMAAQLQAYKLSDFIPRGKLMFMSAGL